MNYCVWIETKEAKLKKSSIEMLSKAASLVKSTGGDLFAICIGDCPTDLKQYAVGKCFHVEELAFNTKSWAKGIAKICQDNNVKVLLGSTSSNCKDTLPKVAAQLKCAMISDVIDVQLDGSNVLAKRPVYSGKLIEKLSADLSSQSLVMSCRSNSFDIESNVASEDSAIESVANDIFSQCQKCKMLEVKENASDLPDLIEADIVVSAGRSIKSKENFSMIHDLAKTLGAAVGASRAAVDAGFAEHDIQVGQTGKTVNPKLYIACGISGAIQHMAGMSASKIIVAINTDPEAPIFQKADYGIVGDMFDVVPKLNSALAELLKEA